MILRDSDFDSYIGIEVVANTDDGKIDPENSGMMEIPVYVLWCPMENVGKKGFSRPDWDKLAFVMDSNGEKYTTSPWAYVILVPRDDNYRSLPMISDYSIIGPFKSINSAWSFWRNHLEDTTNTKYTVKALCGPGSLQEMLYESKKGV